jgi:prepilin-type N-terminal cleavage/methylation domain-containing protein
MIGQHRGFSLIELLMALSVALGLSMMTFQLFHQNERAFRDQTLIMEMQQTARIVASQIADEIRMAGQSVPIFAASFDTVPSEAVAVIFASSNASRIDFRAGLSNVETTTPSSGPNDFTLGASRSLSVASASGFLAGKFVYISAPNSASTWSWLRAELTAVSWSTLTLTPRYTGTSDTTVHLTAAPTVALEEAVSIFLSNGAVRRATGANMSDPAKPVWGPANEIGKNFTALTFTYRDANGDVLQPTSLSNRAAIARVDVRLTVQVASPLSNGARPSYSLELRTIPRNMQIARDPSQNQLRLSPM